MTTWTSHGRDRCSAGEADVVLFPRTYRADGTTLGVIYCHGGGGDALSVRDPVNRAGEWKLVHGIAERHPVVSADLGGPATFGNATAMARIEEARRYLQSTWGARPGAVALVGVSMGGLASLNFAARFPQLVTTVDGVLPLSDLRNLYDGTGGIFKPYLDTAYGLVGSLLGALGIPTDSDPAQNVPALLGLRYHAWYARNDEIVPASTVTSLVQRMGAPAVATDLGPYVHDQAGIGAVPVDQVLAHIASGV
jgi:pimeloyl-ACP methyl ester carboxylesterase